MALLKATIAILLLTVSLASATREFDYFILVRQWGPSFCDEFKCTHQPSKDDFTIHGLWPNYNDGSWPQYCDHKKPFDPKALEELLPRLSDDWPSFMSPNADFWKHEWDKHGTCAESVFASEYDYFERVLFMHENENILGALEAADITPSSTEGYSAKQVAEAIEEALGVQPLLHCNKGEIQEVWLCVTKDLQLRDCGDGALLRLQTRPGHGSNAAACSTIRIPPRHGAQLEAEQMTEQQIMAQQ